MNIAELVRYYKLHVLQAQERAVRRTGRSPMLCASDAGAYHKCDAETDTPPLPMSGGAVPQLNSVGRRAYLPVEVLVLGVLALAFLIFASVLCTTVNCL